MMISMKSVIMNRPHLSPPYSAKKPMISDSPFRQVERDALGLGQGGEEEDEEAQGLEKNPPLRAGSRRGARPGPGRSRRAGARDRP